MLVIAGIGEAHSKMNLGSERYDVIAQKQATTTTTTTKNLMEFRVMDADNAFKNLKRMKCWTCSITE